MLEAGERVLLTFSPDVESHASIVREIFETMMEVREEEARRALLALQPLPNGDAKLSKSPNEGA